MGRGDEDDDEAGAAPEAFDDDDPDFAEEHDTPSLVDEMPGGPEGQPEDDTPHGLAGAD